jgi:uncharacterized membrane protein
MATNEQSAYELRDARGAVEAYRSGIPSRASIARHPIHPILVTFPVTTLVGALITDIVYWSTGDGFWAEASYWLLLAGIVTAVLSAITGMMDFFSIERVRAHAAGWIHAGLNVTALVITMINWWLRSDNTEGAIVPWGLTLSAITAVALAISGWYGGELIYRYKVAVFGDVREADEQRIR